MKTRERQNALPSKIVRRLFVEGRDRMARVSNEADSRSKIALSTLSSRDIRCSSNDLNLVGSNYQ